jgi:hypothetical protein
MSQENVERVRASYEFANRTHTPIWTHSSRTASGTPVRICPMPVSVEDTTAS